MKRWSLRRVWSGTIPAELMHQFGGDHGVFFSSLLLLDLEINPRIRDFYFLGFFLDDLLSRRKMIPDTLVC